MTVKNISFLLGLVALLSVLLLQSCNDDSATVDGDLEPYFERVAQDAQKRGVVLDNDVEAIDGYINNIVRGGADILGACRAPDEGFPRRSIFVDRPFWNDATDLEREFVVYHELGHCFLDRPHLDTQDSLGRCTSIMAAGNAGCIGLEIYSADRREELLDELFR